MEINPRDQKPDEHASATKKSSVPIAVLYILLVAALAAGAWWYLSISNQADTTASSKTMTPLATGQSAPQPTQQPEQDEDQALPVEALSSGEEERPQAVPLDGQEPQQQCAQLSKKLMAFFSHLDQEPYIKEFKLSQPILSHFNQLTTKLLANPPVVTRESDDLYTILTNMAHFFRVIGRQNILLMKGILDRERDKIEDVAAELYKWTLVNQCQDNTFLMQAPLDKVYEYAGFFLNTMGGRSYLFRRDSRSRLLVNYYAVLIVDQANQENQNKYGLDIHEIIPRLTQEIEATNQLIYKEDYLDTLDKLQEKYQN